MLKPRLYWLAFAVGFTVVLFAGCSKESQKSRYLSRADRYFEKEEYEKAKIEYANVLKLDAQNPNAIRQFGLIWSEQGAPMRALPFLLKARDLEPASAMVRNKLAYALASLRQFSEARKEALTILEHSPGHEEALLLLADTSRTQEEIDELERILQTSAKKDSPVYYLVTASLALRKRDLDSAQTALGRALAADPKSAPGHLAMGNLHMLGRKLEEAATEYKTAAGLSTARSTARLRFGEFLAQTGKTSDAAAWVDQICREAADYLPAWNLRAQIALSEKKFDESLGFLQNVFSRDAMNFDARLIEAQVRLAMGDVKKAIENLQSLDKAYPNIPPIKYQLARALYRTGNHNQATIVLKQVVTANPEYTDAILLLSEIELRAGNVQPVIAAMLGVLERQPELAQAQLLLSEAYRSSGRLDDAAALLREQIARTPNSPQPQLLLGLVLRQQGKVSGAREAFEKAQKLVPGSLLPLSQLIDLDIADKAFANALQKVEEWLGKEPRAAGAHFLKGRIYAAQSEWDAAELALQKAIELDADFIGAYDMLSAVYVKAGKLPQAIEQLNGTLAKTPDKTRVLMTTGVIYTKMEQFEKSRDTYEKLLLEKPDFVPALNNLAWLYSEKLNNLAKGNELAQRVRSLQPNDGAIADTFGWILFKTGQYQQALAVLREASGYLPGNAEVSYHLGMASYMMGEKELAAKALRRALDSAETFEGKEQIQQRLSLLEEASDDKPKPSVQELQEILRVQPRDTIAWIRLAEAQEKIGSPAEIAATYEKAIEINPNLLPAILRLAEINAGPLQNPVKALQLAKVAQKLAPNDRLVASRIGQIAYQGGDYAWAYSLLQDGIRGDANGAAVLHDFALAAYNLGKTREAMEIMERLLANEPNARQADEARIFLRLTKIEEDSSSISTDEVDGLLKKIPGNAPALMARARIETNRGDWNSAIATYNEVLRGTPGFAPAQKRLASLYLEKPETREKAYTLALEARKVLPTDPELMKTLGGINYFRGDFVYAVQLLETGERERPLDAKELFYLGMARWRVKPGPTSKDALQRALAAGVAEPLRSEAKRVLAELDNPR